MFVWTCKYCEHVNNGIFVKNAVICQLKIGSAHLRLHRVRNFKALESATRLRIEKRTAQHTKYHPFIWMVSDGYTQAICSISHSRHIFVEFREHTIASMEQCIIASDNKTVSSDNKSVDM